jgi:hypothetical protein
MGLQMLCTDSMPRPDDALRQSERGFDTIRAQVSNRLHTKRGIDLLMLTENVSVLDGQVPHPCPLLLRTGWEHTNGLAPRSRLAE